jgi:uncharacterized protein HemX
MNDPVVEPVATPVADASAPSGAAPPPATSASAAPEAGAVGAATARTPRRWWIALAVGVVALLAVFLDGRVQRQRLAAETQDLAARNEQLRADLERARAQADETQDAANKLRERVDALESQRAALEQLHLELTRGRDDVALFEAERLITLGAQELQVTGHVPTGLAALQAADARLARVDRPQFTPLRRALARDIDRLRAVPVVDITGMALKLDQLTTGIDGWPLLADPAVRPAKAAPTKSAPPAKDAAAASEAAPTAWQRVLAWLADEFGDLVQIREVETPASLLINPAQQQLVRQQLRLRLVSARQALLARNEKLLRVELNEAQALITRHFDARNPNVGGALLQMKQMAQAALSIEVPQPTESLAALRTLRPAGR